MLLKAWSWICTLKPNSEQKEGIEMLQGEAGPLDGVATSSLSSGEVGTTEG